MRCSLVVGTIAVPWLYVRLGSQSAEASSGDAALPRCPCRGFDSCLVETLSPATLNFPPGSLQNKVQIQKKKEKNKTPALSGLFFFYLIKGAPCMKAIYWNIWKTPAGLHWRSLVKFLSPEKVSGWDFFFLLQHIQAELIQLRMKINPMCVPVFFSLPFIPPLAIFSFRFHTFSYLSYGTCFFSHLLCQFFSPFPTSFLLLFLLFRPLFNFAKAMADPQGIYRETDRIVWINQGGWRHDEQTSDYIIPLEWEWRSVLTCIEWPCERFIHPIHK